MKLTICHIRFIQAQGKYSILLLQHSLKKILYFQKVWGDLWAHLQKRDWDIETAISDNVQRYRACFSESKFR